MVWCLQKRTEDGMGDRSFDIGGSVFLTVEELREMIPQFFEVYNKRPIKINFGGMGFNHSFATYAVASKLKPNTVIESGVLRGQSTWILEQACPEAEIFCIDPRPRADQYISDRATYIRDDFSLVNWTNCDPRNTLCFFDDHQNAYTRLMDMKWWGFVHAIFEDNFPCGEGDCYSLRHVLSGFGHPRMQMSTNARGRLWKRMRTKLKEDFLWSFYPRQQVIRKPNTVDRIGFKKNVSIYQELPPVVRYQSNNWGGKWEGQYDSVAPLYAEIAANEHAISLERIDEEDPGRAFKYSYICYVRLI